MSIVVTGAAGFSGRHLVAALERDPEVEVVAVTRARCDLTDAGAVRALLDALRPRQIYHLAGTFSADAAEAWRGNVLTTRNLLSAATELALECRVLLVGSAAEYGPVDASACPIGEAQPLRPVGAYARSKALQTGLMRAHGASQGVAVVMARTFNLLGAGQSPRLLPGRVEQWLRARGRSGSERLRLSDLSQRRDYLPIDDAIAAYRLILHRGAAGAIYHVASGTARTVRDVVHTLLREDGVDPGEIDESPGAAGTGSEAREIWADTSALRALAMESTDLNP